MTAMDSMLFAPLLSVAVALLVSLHLHMNKLNLQKLWELFGRCWQRWHSSSRYTDRRGPFDRKEPDEKDWTQRAQRVEEELQKTRVMFFHSRGRFAVHFVLIMMLVKIVDFLVNPSWKTGSSLAFFVLLYGHFTIFHSLNMIEFLFLHLFLVLNAWWFGDDTDAAILGPTERLHGVSLTLVSSSLLDSRMTVPWCCLEGVLQFCKSWHRFGAAGLTASVVCQEMMVQFLTIMPIIVIETLVRSRIEAVLVKQDESRMVSGFRSVLRGVCDGDVLLDNTFKIVDNGASLDRILFSESQTESAERQEGRATTGTNFLKLIHNAADRKGFVQFISDSIQSSIDTADHTPATMPRAFRVSLQGSRGAVAMDLFHVPISCMGFKQGHNHLLAIKQDADVSLPEAPPETQALPSCYKTLTRQDLKGRQRSRALSSNSSVRSGERELMLSYQNLEEVTLLLTSHTEMWDVHEVHVKYQRQTSIDPGMPTLRNFTRPTDWERILRKIHYVINHAGLTERVLFNHPVWFRMPGESSKYFRARKVTLGHVEEVIEGNPTLLWLNLHTFDFGQDHAVKGSVASRKDE